MFACESAKQNRLSFAVDHFNWGGGGGERSILKEFRRNAGGINRLRIFVNKRIVCWHWCLFTETVILELVENPVEPPPQLRCNGNPPSYVRSFAKVSEGRCSISLTVSKNRILGQQFDVNDLFNVFFYLSGAQKITNSETAINLG